MAVCHWVSPAGQSADTDWFVFPQLDSLLTDWSGFPQVDSLLTLIGSCFLSWTVC